MTGSARIVASIAAVVLVAGTAAAFAVAWRPAIAAIDPPAPQSFDPALVKRGRELAAIGNCNDCHTVRGAKNFAGGLPVPTPFGTIFSSNITPDAETGIGRWSEAAFQRAMRSGVNREGQHLYPTFPYDHFTNVTDEDDQALYAFLMTRQPVRAPARENQLSFPVQPAAAMSRAGNCCSCVTAPISPTPRKAPNGIAAPTWSKGWPIAAPAIRRAMRWARKVPVRSLPAATSTTGTPMRINGQSPRAGAVGCGCAVCLSCATAGIPTTASRADRWRRWSAICLRCRQATFAPSRSIWPAYSARRRRTASAETTRCWRRPNRSAEASQDQPGRCSDLRSRLRDMP